jgi:homoserine dehydrogenase
VYSVEAIDFVYARELNCTIRQISSATREPGGGARLSASVQPALVPLSSLVAHVQGSQNLVVATGQFAGQIMLSGYGAGGNPTAVAVISDLHTIARTGGMASIEHEQHIETPSSVSGELTVPHYLRLVIKDRPGIVAEVAAVLARHGISIDALLQKPGYAHTALPFIITLEACSSGLLQKALQEIERLDFHVEPPLCLPIYRD